MPGDISSKLCALRPCTENGGALVEQSLSLQPPGQGRDGGAGEHHGREPQINHSPAHSRENSSEILRTKPRVAISSVAVSHDRRVRRHASDSENCAARSEEHTSELQSLLRISYAGFCLKKKKQQ